MPEEVEPWHCCSREEYLSHDPESVGYILFRQKEPPSDSAGFTVSKSVQRLQISTTRELFFLGQCYILLTLGHEINIPTNSIPELWNHQPMRFLISRLNHWCVSI